jgi:tetratricopeptide (TPR) repeat protein
MRYYVRRIAFLIIVLAPPLGLTPLHAQVQPQGSREPSAAGATQNDAPQVAEAEAAIVKSDWKAAQAKLDEWLTSHPLDGRALFDAGYVADAQGRLDEAEKLYRRAVDADPKSFQAHLSLGLLLARRGKESDARSELLAATTVSSGEVDRALKARAWRALAQLDKPGPDKGGEATQASTDLLEALKLSPETPDDTLLAAELAEASGQHEIAAAAYRRMLATDPNSVEAKSGLVHVLITQKQYPEAEKLIRSALTQSPDAPVLNAQLATVLAAEDNPEALPLLQKLHDAHPENQSITRMLAAVLSDAGDAQGSDKLYVSLLITHPDETALVVPHGQNLIRQLKYPEALAAFDKATKLDPSNGDAWGGLAFAASKMHQPTLTLHALTVRSKFLPEVPATYFLWATSYDTLHDRVAAATYYHHFLESSGGKFPDQEWQAQQRLRILEKK